MMNINYRAAILISLAVGTLALARVCVESHHTIYVVPEAGASALAQSRDRGIKLASWYDYSLPEYPQYSRLNATAASRDFPRRSFLEVCNVKNRACVVVRVNDYGPNAAIHPDRAIDLSSYAFSKIASLSSGLAEVEVREVQK